MRFLVLWLVAFVTLMLTLRLLSSVYAAFGGDLGLSGWKRETVIAAVTAFLQAIFLWLSVAATGKLVSKILLAAGAVSFLSYKLTHLPTGVFEGTSEMDDGQAGAIAVTQIAILILGSLAVAAYLA